MPDLREELMSEIKNLSDQRIATELYSKRANLLFYGIPETKDEDSEVVIKGFIKKHLDIVPNDILFANVHRLPTRTTSKDARPKPIIAKFVQMKDRELILSAAPRLRNSTMKFGISPHLPSCMQQARQKLLPIRREAIAAGKRAFIKTTGITVNLYIDNQLYKPKKN